MGEESTPEHKTIKCLFCCYCLLFIIISSVLHLIFLSHFIKININRLTNRYFYFVSFGAGETCRASRVLNSLENTKIFIFIVLIPAQKCLKPGGKPCMISSYVCIYDVVCLSGFRYLVQLKNGRSKNVLSGAKILILPKQRIAKIQGFPTLENFLLKDAENQK